MKIWLLVPLLVFSVATSSFAQMSDPQIAAFKSQYDIAKGYVTKSAEKVSDDLYSFQPTPEVRTFGKILAHIADANYMLCSGAKGEKSPVEMMSLEKTKTTKADIQKALADSYAYCDGAFASLTPAQAAEKVDFFGMAWTKLSMLSFAGTHSFEHYGNLATYMRIKNIVPPSSEPKPTPTSGTQPSN
jgi:uncharacterized damage-inducible protein DinB